MTTIQEPTLTTARKVHSCDFCCSEIQRGETYMRSTYKYDTIYPWRTHKKCHGLAERLEMYKGRESVDGEDFEGDVTMAYRDVLGELGMKYSESTTTKERVDFLTAHFYKIDKINLFEFRYGDGAIDWVSGIDLDDAINNLSRFTSNTREELLCNCETSQIKEEDDPDWRFSESGNLSSSKTLWEYFEAWKVMYEDPFFLSTEF